MGGECQKTHTSGRCDHRPYDLCTVQNGHIVGQRKYVASAFYISRSWGLDQAERNRKIKLKGLETTPAILDLLSMRKS
jgi:hypothetical protein